MATQGCDYLACSYFPETTSGAEEVICRFKLWDTGGQERYNALVASYFNSVDGVILAFDLTNSQSFKDITGWISLVD